MNEKQKVMWTPDNSVKGFQAVIGDNIYSIIHSDFYADGEYRVLHNGVIVSQKPTVEAAKAYAAQHAPPESEAPAPVVSCAWMRALAEVADYQVRVGSRICTQEEADQWIWGNIPFADPAALEDDEGESPNETIDQLRQENARLQQRVAELEDIIKRARSKTLDGSYGAAFSILQELKS